MNTAIQHPEPVKVLLVEDNPGDIRLTQEAFRRTNNSIHLLIATDGEEALTLLKCGGPFLHAPRPDLILLDLNLPGKGGREVLNEIKQDPNLKTIPVVILTTSDAMEDIQQSYLHRASCYLTKPIQLVAFENLIHSINAFWLQQAKLPRSQWA